MYLFKAYRLLRSQKNIVKIAFIFCALFFGCKKKTAQDNIPYQNVNTVIYINDPLNFKLQVVGGWLYYNNIGVNGIIVYRKTTINQNDFIALERTSTFLPNNPAARVKVEFDNFTLTDTISGSKWQIIDGSAIKGPASLPLKTYNTNYDGNTGALTIRN